jgi:hypothetical protein
LYDPCFPESFSYGKPARQSAFDLNMLRSLDVTAQGEISMIYIASPKRAVGHPDRALDCEEALEVALKHLSENDTLTEEAIETQLLEGGVTAGWEEAELRVAIADLRRNAALGLQGLSG